MSIRRLLKDSGKGEAKDKDKDSKSLVAKERTIIWIDDRPSGEAHHLAALWGRTDPQIEFKIFTSYDDLRTFVAQNEKTLKGAKKKIRVISSRTREDNGNAEKLLLWLRAESPFASSKVLLLLADMKQSFGIEHFANSKTFIDTDISFCQEFALFRSTSAARKEKDRKSKMLSRSSGGGFSTLLRSSSGTASSPAVATPVVVAKDATILRSASPSVPVRPTDSTLNISLPFAVSRGSNPGDAADMAEKKKPQQQGVKQISSPLSTPVASVPLPMATSAVSSGAPPEPRKSPRHMAILPMTVLYVDDLGGPLSSAMLHFRGADGGSYFGFATAAEVEAWIKERKADMKQLAEVRVICNRDASIGHHGVEAFVTWVRQKSPFPRAKALVYCKSTAGVSFPSLHLLGFGLTFVSADMNYLISFATFEAKVKYVEAPVTSSTANTRSRATVTIGTTDEATLPPALQQQKPVVPPLSTPTSQPAPPLLSTVAPKIHVSAQQLEELKEKAIREYERSLNSAAVASHSHKGTLKRLGIGLGLAKKERKASRREDNATEKGRIPSTELAPAKRSSSSASSLTSSSSSNSPTVSAPHLRSSPRSPRGWSPVSVSTPSAVPALKLTSPRAAYSNAMTSPKLYSTTTPTASSNPSLGLSATGTRSDRSGTVHMIPLNELEAMLGDLPAMPEKKKEEVLPPRPQRAPPASPKSPKKPAGLMIPQEDLEEMLGDTLGDSSPLAMTKSPAQTVLKFSDDDHDDEINKSDRSPSVWARESLDELTAELKKDTAEARYARISIQAMEPLKLMESPAPPTPVAQPNAEEKRPETRAPAVTFSLPRMAGVPPTAPQPPPTSTQRVWRSKQTTGDITRGEKVQVLPDLGLDSIFGTSKDMLKSAPNGTVYRWRIEAMVPVLRNAPAPLSVQHEPLNIFCSRDCYLVAAAPAPPRETLWCVYYWIGKQASPDKIGAVAIRATQLNQLLGGAARHQREEEGEETDAFIKIFPEGLEIDHEGGTDSALRSAVLLPPAASLYRLLASPPTHALHRVPMLVQCLDMSHMYLLDAGDALFLWSATAPDSTSRMWLRDLVSLVGVSERSSRAVIHLLEGTHLPVSESTQMFLSLLSARFEVDNDGCYILPDLAHSIPSALSRRMYRNSTLSVAIGETLICSEMWSAEIENPETPGGLLPALAPQSLLADDECRILDCGSELFFWMGKRSPLPLRKVAEGLLSQLQQSGGREEWVPLPYSLLQGRESVYFRSQFSGWVDPRRDVSSRLRPAAAANKKLQENKSAQLREKERKPFTHRDYARLQAPQDDSEVSSAVLMEESERSAVTVYLLLKSGSKAEPISGSEIGQFYSGECYVIVDPRRPRPTLYFWQGAEAPPRTWPTFCLSLAPSVELEVTQRGLPPPSRVPLLQGREPPVFWSLFGDGLTMHQGKRPPTGVPEPRVALYQLRCIANPPRLLATETIPLCSSLQSRYSYLLRTFARILRWNGTLAPPLSSAALDPIIATLSQDGLVPLANAKEGSEPAEFWDYLGGRQVYTNDQFWRSHSQPARLFCLSRLLEDGQIDEVKPYTQADLTEAENAAFLLDHCDSSTMYLWIARVASEAQHASAVFLSLCYCRSQERAANLPNCALQLKIAVEGNEPAEFSGYFPYWYQREGAPPPSDEAVKIATERTEKLIMELSQKVAEAQSRPEPEPIIVEVKKVPISRPILPGGPRNATLQAKSTAIMAAAAALQPQLLASRSSNAGVNAASTVISPSAALTASTLAASRDIPLQPSSSLPDPSSLPASLSRGETESDQTLPKKEEMARLSPLASLPQRTRQPAAVVQRLAGPTGRRPRTKKGRAATGSSRSSFDPESPALHSTEPISIDEKLLEAARKLDELPEEVMNERTLGSSSAHSREESISAESDNPSSTTDHDPQIGVLNAVPTRLAPELLPSPSPSPVTSSLRDSSAGTTSALPALVSLPPPLIMKGVNAPALRSATGLPLPPAPAVLSLLSRTSHTPLPSAPPPPPPSIAETLSVPREPEGKASTSLPLSLSDPRDAPSPPAPNLPPLGLRWYSFLTDPLSLPLPLAEKTAALLAAEEIEVSQLEDLNEATLLTLTLKADEARLVNQAITEFQARNI